MATANLPEITDERARLLLKLLVERYIRDGQPVGSRTLSKDSGLNISAATVRNVMADLEEFGFLAAPHTSAGRIPTDKGYRFFVDSLLKLKPLRGQEIARLERALSGDTGDDGKALASAASTLLSGITSLAGVVTLPRQSHAELRQIEFLPLSDNRVLAIMVVNVSEVQNRVLNLDREHSADELRAAANYLNEQFAGRDLGAVREHLLEELKQTCDHMTSLMTDAITMAEQAFDLQPKLEPEFVLAGETNLMDFEELSDVEKLRRLFEAFNKRRDILKLLDNSLSATGVQIFIGGESGYQILDECSLVTAPYAVEGEVLGVLGVIGPTRMAYERVIPIVDLTAKLLGSALNSQG